jgi:hypothetical protein
VGGVDRHTTPSMAPSAELAKTLTAAQASSRRRGAMLGHAPRGQRGTLSA